MGVTDKGVTRTSNKLNAGVKRRTIISAFSDEESIEEY